MKELVVLGIAFEGGLHEWDIDVGLGGGISGRQLHDFLTLHQKGMIELSFGQQEIVFEGFQMKKKLGLDNDQMP